MNCTLIRHFYGHDCTLGWLIVGPVKFATIERPWLPAEDGPGGKLRESCIPDGDYRIIPHTSPKFPDTYALVNHDHGVYYQPKDKPAGQPWGRTAILIHVGNFPTDVIGCIAVGQAHGGHSVMRSREAMGQLRTILGRERHTLHIHPFTTTLGARL